MSKVLIPLESAWYHELKAVAYYGETDLEIRIKDHLKSLFPDFYVFPFKKDVKSRVTDEVKRPDLAMIRKDFAAWGVVEVELAEHSIGHVIEQTRVFSEGEYNAPEIVDYIKTQLKLHCSKSVSEKKLSILIANEVPSILVIVDSHIDKWKQELAKIGAKLCVFEIFKNTKRRYLYRTFGDYPIVPIREAHLRKHAMLANTIEVVGGFEFKNLESNNEVSIDCDGKLTKWALVRSGGNSYLKFLGKVFPLSSGDSYVLISDKSNKYYVKIS